VDLDSLHQLAVAAVDGEFLLFPSDQGQAQHQGQGRSVSMTRSVLIE
jgi:hypothetical protein